MSEFISIFLVLVSLALVLFVGYRVVKKRNRVAPARGPRIAAEKKGAPPSESLRDEVTDLYNRKHLIRRLKEGIARCERNHEAMSLVLWDIDGFVDFNNRYGQKYGDELLRKVGATIRKSVRVYDEAFRTGPDEFCALLLPADDKLTREVRRRVGEIVSKELFEGKAEYASYPFSISSGVTVYPGENKIPEALLHAAGQDLYQSRLAKFRS